MRFNKSDLSRLFCSQLRESFAGRTTGGQLTLPSTKRVETRQDNCHFVPKKEQFLTTRKFLVVRNCLTPRRKSRFLSLNVSKYLASQKWPATDLTPRPAQSKLNRVGSFGAGPANANQVILPDPRSRRRRRVTRHRIWVCCKTQFLAITNPHAFLKYSPRSNRDRIRRPLTITETAGVPVVAS